MRDEGKRNLTCGGCFQTKAHSDNARATEIVCLMLHELNGQVDASLRLQEISTLLIQEGNLDALYERVLDAAVCLMAADVGSMQKYDPEQDQLRLLATRGFNPEAIEFWQRVNRQSGTSCGMALSVGRRVVVPDIEYCGLHGRFGRPRRRPSSGSSGYALNAARLALWAAAGHDINSLAASRTRRQNTSFEH